MCCCSKKDLGVHAIVVGLAVAADAAVVCAVEQTKTKKRVGVFVTALSELAEPGAVAASFASADAFGHRDGHAIVLCLTRSHKWNNILVFRCPTFYQTHSGSKSSPIFFLSSSTISDTNHPYHFLQTPSFH